MESGPLVSTLMSWTNKCFEVGAVVCFFCRILYQYLFDTTYLPYLPMYLHIC